MLFLTKIVAVIFAFQVGHLVLLFSKNLTKCPIFSPNFLLLSYFFGLCPIFQRKEPICSKGTTINDLGGTEKMKEKNSKALLQEKKILKWDP